MPELLPITRTDQREEPWTNGAGSTTVILREPDDKNWRVRISVATVDREGPFSELPATRRVLVPLDAPMTLRFPDGHELRGPRMSVLRFDGAPAPTGLLPDGPTRDFNLMLRGDAQGELMPRTLVDSMFLPAGPGLRWVVYLDRGSATIRSGARDRLALEPRDAALVAAGDDPGRVLVEGAGEIVLAKLYASAQNP